MAGNHPDEPSPTQQEAAAGLVRAVAELHPCGSCREGFAAHVAASPPDVSSRRAFSLWLCERHNEVNADIGRPQFPCTLEALDARWVAGSAGGRAECKKDGWLGSPHWLWKEREEARVAATGG
jgi:FAD-linked sulfhydryl oxidase